MTERTATKVLKYIAITTVVFLIAEYVSFLITRQEQEVLIKCYFTAVVGELGFMIAKRLMEIRTARIEKKEQIKVEPIEKTTDYYLESENFENGNG